MLRCAPNRAFARERIYAHAVAMKNHLFTILALFFLLLAIASALVDLKVALFLITGVLTAGIGLLIYRLLKIR